MGGVIHPSHIILERHTLACSFCNPPISMLTQPNQPFIFPLLSLSSNSSVSLTVTPLGPAALHHPHNSRSHDHLSPGLLLLPSD